MPSLNALPSRSKGKRLLDWAISAVCHVLRYFPIRHEAGLIRIGNPGPESPVFVSGDYFSTARRVIRSLTGHDCYLLVVDSAGINVWCAAGVGDVNEHKIADAVNAANLHGIVSHRRLILPQLIAVGVDRDALYKECGFRAIWGPASLLDIGAFIANGYETTQQMRLVRFAFRDRVSLVLGQLFNYFVFYLFYFLYGSIFGWRLNDRAAFVAVILFYTIAVTAFMQYMPFKYPPSNVLFCSILPFTALFAHAFLRSPVPISHLAFQLIATGVITLLICMDMIGSTVYYKSTVGHWWITFTNRSLFQPQIIGRCTRCGECLKVCPKGLFSKNSTGGVEIDLTKECCECLACVRQCAAVAIENVTRGCYKHDIKCIPDDIFRRVM